MRRLYSLLMFTGALLWLSGTGPAAPEGSLAPDKSVPLLTWDLLTTTVYDPRRPLIYPPGVEAVNGATVRMEGFLMPRYDSQDAGDLFLTALNPRNYFCGPSDVTQMVELFIPGLKTIELPTLPVEVIGTFHLSRRVNDFRPIYMFLATSWRPLHTWEQQFPGVTDEERRRDVDPSFGSGG